MASTSNSTIPRAIKRKDKLHGCRLCPQLKFPRDATSVARPNNPSLQNHVNKFHPGSYWKDLSISWGHRVYYKDGPAENVPYPATTPYPVTTAPTGYQGEAKSSYEEINDPEIPNLTSTEPYQTTQIDDERLADILRAEIRRLDSLHADILPYTRPHDEEDQMDISSSIPIDPQLLAEDEQRDDKK